MRSSLLPSLAFSSACIFGSQAFAQSTVSFHVKAHSQNCNQVLFEYKDTKTPGAKQIREVIENPAGSKGEFSPLIKVDVKPGHNHIAQITCKGATASKDYSLIHTWDKRLLAEPLPGFKMDELHYDVAAGETIYLGAFERLDMGKYTARKTGVILDLRAPIVSDQSTRAVENGTLAMGAFRPSLIGVTFDVDSVLGRQEKLNAAKDLNSVMMKAMGLNETIETPAPSGGGKGELALHYANDLRCVKPKLRLTRLDSNGKAEKSTDFKLKTKNDRATDGLNFKSLASGRYELRALRCKRIFTPDDLYAVFDVHDGETTYGGEVNIDVKLSGRGRSFKLSTKDRYEDAQSEGGAKFDMVNQNGFTRAVFEAQNAGMFTRANQKLGIKLPYFKKYKSAQTEYADRLVLPTPKAAK